MIPKDADPLEHLASLTDGTFVALDLVAAEVGSARMRFPRTNARL